MVPIVKKRPSIWTVTIALICTAAVFLLLRAFLSTSEYEPPPVLLNYTDSEHGFSFKYPQYWIDEPPIRFRSDPGGLIARLLSPEIEVLEGYRSMASMNVRSGIQPSEGDEEVTLEDYVAKCEENLENNTPHYARISLTETTISDLPALVLNWRMGEGEETVITKQAIFFKGYSFYVITYLSPEEYNDEYASAFDLVISTFKFHE